MNESIIDFPKVPRMELNHKGDNDNMAVNKGHSESDATAITTTAIASVATASPANQRIKRKLASEISIEGQRETSSESNETSVKQPRLDSILDEPPFSHLSQLQLLYQPWNPSPLAAQTITDLNRHYSDFMPLDASPNDYEEPGTPFDRWDSEPTTVRSAPTFLPQAIPQFGTLQQTQHVADPEAHSPQRQTSSPQSFLEGSPRAQTSHSLQASHAMRQYTPSAKSIEKQTRQFDGISVTFSKPAQPDDLDLFSKTQKRVIAAYAKSEQGKGDEFFMQWHSGIRRPFWGKILTLFGENVPASIYQQVLDELCASHPCVSDAWTGHALYRDMVGTSQSRKPKPRIYALEDWMYGAGATTHATWRDTLSTKVGPDTKVPWVKRAKVIALCVILACDQEGSKKKRESKNVRSKRDLLEKCKLLYLVSDQDHVVANEYWDGFAEELEEDPEQERLYDKVVQANQSGPPGNTATWPSAPNNGQESQVWEEQDHSRSGGYQTSANTGENISQDSDNHEPSSVAQLSLLPVEDPSQETKHGQSPVTHEMSLQNRVEQLEGQVTEMRSYIELMHQHFPGFLARPPWASSQHQP